MARVHPDLLRWSGLQYAFRYISGRGSYGSVEIFQTMDPKALHPFIALKCIPTINIGLCPSAVREMCCLSMLQHPCVVRLLDVVHILGYTILYLEYMRQNLCGYLLQVKLRHQRLPLRVVQEYSRQLLRALHYCHSQGVIHRDVKPANLLLKKGTFLKLADFGLAQKPCTSFLLSTNMVSLWYRAPELIRGAESYSSKVDMWSVGCVLAELCSGEVLFRGLGPRAVWDRMKAVLGPISVVEDTPVSKKRIVGDAVCNNLLLGLLEYDPVKRLSARQALGHAFFSTEY